MEFFFQKFMEHLDNRTGYFLIEEEIEEYKESCQKYVSGEKVEDLQELQKFAKHCPKSLDPISKNLPEVFDIQTVRDYQIVQNLIAYRINFEQIVFLDIGKTLTGGLEEIKRLISELKIKNCYLYRRCFLSYRLLPISPEYLRSYCFSDDCKDCQNKIEKGLLGYQVDDYSWYQEFNTNPFVYSAFLFIEEKIPRLLCKECIQEKIDKKLALSIKSE